MTAEGTRRTECAPRVSIVLPCLNAAATIGKTLESVRRDGYPNKELWVVDGGSSDRTLEIVRSYSDVVTGCTSERDAGISDAFNKGIRRSTGAVVGIVGADDFLVPGAVNRVAAAVATKRDMDVIFGDALAIEGTAVLANRAHSGPLALPRHYTLKHAATWIARDAYERFGVYSTEFRYAMDYELLARFHLAGACFVKIDGFLGAYRTGGVNSVQRARTIAEVCVIARRFGVGTFTAQVDRSRKLASAAFKRFVPSTFEATVRAWSRKRRGIVPLDAAQLGVADYL